MKESNLPPLNIVWKEPSSGFKAQTEKNIIVIKPNLSIPEQRRLAIFELHNVINTQRFLKVHKDIYLYKKADEFAMANEEIEYDGLVEADIVYNQAIKVKGQHWIARTWNSKILKKGFQFFYKILNEKHKNHYRSYYSEWKESECKRIAFREESIKLSNLLSKFLKEIRI